MANRIQLRRDTAANWTRVNPILEDGEPGLEIDSNRVKYGDGNTVWNSLDYAGGSTTTDRLTNNGNELIFNSNGVLNFPNNNGQIGQLEPPYTGLEFRTGSGADWIGISYGEINDNNTSYFYFDKDGSDYLTANHRAHLQIKNPAHDGHVEWLFESDGKLTAPGNLVIAGNTSVFGTDAALIQPSDGLPMIALSTGTNGAVSSVWIEDVGNIGTSNIAAVYTNPTVGSKIVRIAVGQNGGPGPNLWDFGTDGNLTLPPNGDILVNGGANSAIHDLLQNDVHTDADHYTLALSDRGKMIYQTGGYNVIVPAADGSTITFPVSTVITIVNSGGAGDLNIVAADGGTNTDIYGAGTDTNSYVWALPSNSIATLIKVEGSGTYSKWLLSGVGIYDNS